jgi:hypothetical protein
MNEVLVKLTRAEYDSYRAKGYKIKIQRVYTQQEGLELSHSYELGASYVVEKKIKGGNNE